MAKTIMVVDDDPHIREVVTFALETVGMNAICACDGKEAMSLYDTRNHDMVILDINMPEMDGWEVCKELRKESDIPILFLSSRDNEIDRVVGLEIGADDYLVKPFSPRELVARVKAILKRYRKGLLEDNTETLFKRGDLILDITKHQIFWKDIEIDLTATEFAILHGMLQKPDIVFDREQIMALAYRININVSDRTIDSHIRNIRKKLTNAGCLGVIQTVRGVGYKLTI